MSWNKSQTLLLISEYQRHEAKVTSGLLRKKMLWQKIETVFKEHGYSFTADQISGRWKTITRAFKNTKDHNKKSGNDKKHYEFEDALNDVLGDCPTVNPVTISSVKKRKLPDVDSESTEGEDDCSCSKSDSNESSKQKSKKTNSSEIINLLKQHSEQQREFQSEYRQMQAKESERRQKEHSERLLVLNSLIDAIKSNKK
ncbi:uncharacterized protein LOC132563106 [Ylistrum balloti]|nr:uncharacterized protein LOC132563106 [Ylistrum balloti]